MRSRWRWAWAALLVLWAACGDDAPARDAQVDAALDAQVDAATDAQVEALPACEGTIASLLTGATSASPAADSDGYAPPDALRRDHLKDTLRHLLSGDVAAALTSAAAADYDLCGDSGAGLLRPSTSGGHAWIAVRLGDARPVIVGVPHPNFELHTLDQGVLGWTTWNARAVVVAGTHRCANPAASGCSGSTGVCTAQSAPYRESDMAHTEVSLFHAAHEALLAEEPALVVLSLHGMSGSGVSLSNGTTGNVIATDLLSRAAQALAAALPGENITACNPGAGVPQDQRLCGTTNTQGRLVNHAPDPCTQGATAVSGRFLHLEQSLTVRQAPTAVVTALDGVLP